MDSVESLLSSENYQTAVIGKDDCIIVLTTNDNHKKIKEKLLIM